MKRIAIRNGKFALTFILNLAITGIAAAETYNANSFLPPTHPQGKVLIDYAADVLAATDGRVNFKVYTGGSLMPAREGLQALEQGIAQIGYVAGTYTPNELPLANVLADLAFNTPDMMVAAFAYTEVNLTNPQLQQEWLSKNIVFGIGHSTDSYRFICKGEASNINFLKGKKVRTPGGLWSRFAEYVGAVPVNVPASEMFTGLERGLLDCVNNEVVSLKDRSLWDVANSVNMISLGTYSSGTGFSYNKKFWQSLDDKTRAILLKNAAVALARMQSESYQSNSVARSEAEKKGISFFDPGTALITAVEKFRAKDLETLLTKGRYGVSDPAPVVDAYLAAVKRWTALLSGVDYADFDALKKLSENKLFGVVDVSSYGMAK